MQRFIFQFIFLIIMSLSANSQSGTIRGIVFDGETGEYLVGVTVYEESTQTGTITDLDGNFNMNIAPGTYSIRISYISYESLQITDVEVSSGEVTSLGEIKLEEATISLNEVTIVANAVRNTEAALISIKRKSANVLDGISEGSIKRIGESDAAGAMKRIPGVSVSGGKYVYVKGLGDRYTKSLLNGVDIPGLDPDRNTMQMDIFPTAVINNIIVHKTFSAELPADFTGGAIDIEIKDFPDKKQSIISLGVGYNPNAHFNRDYLTYEGGKTDFLGFDDGTRAIPVTENIPQFAEAVGNPNGPAGLRYQEILQSFHPTMAAMQKMSLTDFIFGFSYGNQKPKEKYTLGYNFSLDYKNTTEFFKDAEYGRYGLSSSSIYQMERREYQAGSFGVNKVLLSGLAGLDYSERSFTLLLLDGNHTNLDKGLRINWKLAFTYSILYDPDIRFTRYEVIDDGSLRIGTEVGFPERIWRNLNEINTTALVNVTKDFQFRENSSKLNFGILGTYKYKTYIIRNFAINLRGDFPLTGDPDELFSEENLWPKDGQVDVGTTYETPFVPYNPNQYNASSINTAAYVSTELAVLSNLKAIVGVRLENFMQYYTGSDQQRENVLENERVLSDLGLFPSLNLLFQITKQQNLRLSYTKTIARPSFKELSCAEIYDPITGITFLGGFHKDLDELAGVEYWSGNLVSTDIQNFNLRWERYGTNGELLSISGFYKIFKNPIEIVQYTKQVGAFQPRNVGDGQSYGAEFEIRQSMGIVSENLSGLHISANLTINKSSIKMSDTEYQSRLDNAREGQTIDNYRVMAGQAPYLINGGIYFAGEENGFRKRLEAGLYYNVQGSTLEYVGAADRPDIYTKPFQSLNLNVSVKLGKESQMKLGLKIENMLNEEIQLVYKSYRANDQYFERRSPGILSTLKFSYNF